MSGGEISPVMKILTTRSRRSLQYEETDLGKVTYIPLIDCSELLDPLFIVKGGKFDFLTCFLLYIFVQLPRVSINQIMLFEYQDNSSNTISCRQHLKTQQQLPRTFRYLNCTQHHVQSLIPAFYWAVSITLKQLSSLSNIKHRFYGQFKVLHWRYGSENFQEFCLAISLETD